MKQILAISAVLVQLVSLTLAQTFAINNPIAGTEWSAGSNVKISWVKADSSSISSPQFIKLDLVTGDSNNLQQVSQIISQLPADQTSYTWSVPDNLPSGSDYSVRITTTDGSGASDVNYSHVFDISGGSSSPPPSSSTPSSTQPSGSSTKNPVATVIVSPPGDNSTGSNTTFANTTDSDLANAGQSGHNGLQMASLTLISAFAYFFL